MHLVIANNQPTYHLPGWIIPAALVIVVICFIGVATWYNRKQK